METILNRTTPPGTVDIDKVIIQQPVKKVLGNGIPVFAINAGFQDLVKVELIFRNLPFDVTKPLVSSATNRMLSEGTSKYTAQQLADNIDYFGAFYETDENSDFCSVNLFTLNKYLDQTLPFVKEMLVDPVFPEKELAIYSQNNKQRLNVDNEKVNSVARRTFNQVIFGNAHPYGYLALPSDFDNLKREDLVDHHRQKYVAENCTIIISGLTTDVSIELIDKHFSLLPRRNEVVENTIFDHSPVSERLHLVQKEGAIQSAIRIGKPFFNRTHADYPGMAVLNTVLGGYFGSRLMSNIREEKGFTYGIGSAVVSMKRDGYFFISTEVGAGVTQPALDEIYYEIELLRKETVEQEELSMVRNYMLGTFLKGIDGAFQLAERFKSIYLYNLDYSYYENYLNKVKSIQPDELLDLARKYFTSDSLYEVVVGSK